MRTLFTLNLYILGILFVFSTGVFAQSFNSQPIRSYRDVAPDSDTEMRYREYFTQTDSQNVDVLHYDLHLDLTEHSTQNIAGSVTLTGVATGILSSLEIDLTSQLSVTSIVNADLDTMSWDHQSDIITVTPDAVWQSGDTLALMIVYEGTPLGAYGEGLDYRAHNGTPVIYSLSEPDFASWWWPCIDIPYDKTTFTGHFTVPEDWTAASNGTLTNVSTDETAGTATYTWEEGYPISTYLVSIVATNFVHFSDVYIGLDGSSMPVDYYVYPEDSADAAEDFNVTVPILGTFADLFGEYPFLSEKYGMAEFPWGGGMEHQTMTSYGAGLINGNHYYDWINAHETAHQWFGNSVTLGDWRDIWLNEGFATYGDALWHEANYGGASFQSRLSSFRNTYFNEDATLRYPIYDPPEGYLFGAAEYEKGAWVLHMLRKIVGDSTFFDILTEYRDTYEFSNAVTTDFIDIVNSVTDTTYQWFFDQWIYQAGYPEYEFEYVTSSDGNAYTTTIYIDQVQFNAPIFTMPIDFRLASGQDTVTVTHWNNSPSDSFSVQTDFYPESVEFDPGNAILKKVYNSQRYTLSGGVVTGPDSTGVPEATVLIGGPYGGDGNPSVITDTTDANGEFSFSLRPGLYALQTFKQGYINSIERLVELDGPISSFALQLTQPSFSLNAPDTISARIAPGDMFRDTIRVTNSGFGPMLTSITPHPSNPFAGDGIQFPGYSINSDPLPILRNIRENFNGGDLTLARQTQTPPVDSLYQLVYAEPEPDTTNFVDIHQLLMQVDDQSLYLHLNAHNSWLSLSSFQFIMIIETDMSTPEAEYLILVTDFGQFRGAVFEKTGTAGNYSYVASANYEDISPNSSEFTMGFPLSAFGNDNVFMFRAYTVNAQSTLPFGIDYFPALNLSALLYSLEQPSWFQLAPLYTLTPTNSTTTYLMTIDGDSIPQDRRTGALLFAATDPSGQTSAIPFMFNTGVSTKPSNTLPKKFEMSRNYPNPFNPETNINYALPQSGTVTFSIYNLRGELVFKSTEVRQPGHYTFQWNGRGNNGLQVSGGMYFLRMDYTPVQELSRTETQKIILLK